jgi:hypothetical protein
MIEPIDFTDCERLPGRAYNGANGKKIAVRYDDDVWLLKFPPSTAEKPTTLSYSNSCYSEHLASTIANMIGLKAQETRLGTFTNGKTKVVCACRDFTADGKVLYDFCSIKNTVIDSDTCGTGTEMNDVLETIELQSFVDPVELKAHFWDMFVVDAFLGNFDRHNGNWGFLVDPTTRKAEIAPAFDFGSCLLPQADDDIMRRVIGDKAELDARIYNFPASALKQEGKKIGYVDFIAQNRDGVLAPSLARIVPRIDLAAINAFIDDTPYLADHQRRFYKVYLAARFSALFASGE